MQKAALNRAARLQPVYPATIYLGWFPLFLAIYSVREQLCKHPTVCVTGGGAGKDNAREQEKLAARKMTENAKEPPPYTTHFVGRLVLKLPLFYQV